MHIFCVKGAWLWITILVWTYNFRTIQQWTFLSEQGYCIMTINRCTQNNFQQWLQKIHFTSTIHRWFTTETMIPCRSHAHSAILQINQILFWHFRVLISTQGFCLFVAVFNGLNSDVTRPNHALFEFNQRYGSTLLITKPD